MIESEKLPSIGKLEAARRQIDFSIFAHFSDLDPFAIHTVISAAAVILRDLAERHGSIKFHQATTDIIVPGKEPEYWNYINRPSNFLKHADRDPEATLDNVNAEINDVAIFSASLYYKELSSAPLTHSMRIFSAWFAALHPNIIKEEFRTQVLVEQFDLHKTLPRKLRLEAGLSLLRKAIADGGNSNAKYE